MNRVSKGFIDRVSPDVDPEILRRIVVSFQKAKRAQQLAASVYQVGNEWLPIYESCMGEIINTLSNGDLPGLQKIYGNFWRDQCSSGLIGFGHDANQKYFGKNISEKDKKTFLADTIHRYNLWMRQLAGQYTASDLAGPDIGNPFGYELDGIFVRSGSDYLHYYSVAIARYLKDVCRHKIVMEVGGGFGGMAYYLLRDNLDITYVDFDLPENMALTAYYLMTAFTDKKILLYGEASLVDVNLNDYAAVIMPNFEIQNMHKLSSDIAFNSYSLAEMSKETIEKYIIEIQRISRKYFLHVNHTRNCVVSADDFGVNAKLFDLMHRAPALWNLGRNPNMDEFEYLYKRIEDCV
ncbi:MAG: hypothetical protein A2091_02565 [Desulfuromonadales bacterium GWD2_61_12]|nr:MAG: hypothetical protein A2005_03940 [Desulfuromonadales bacterium GWC2_61_20]OGR35412.1 MAG: hypothetical protein A2091_02565 [Desulfuromonadales bacterium GWD2_61_12]